MAEDALRALLRDSAVLWSAVTDSQGTIREVNAALAGATGRKLVGEPATTLVTKPQRPGLERRIADAGPDWDRAILAFHTDGSESATDCVVRIRRDGDDVLIAAEAAIGEGARLVDQVLALNDDLISAQRSLGRRQRELEVAEASSRAASERGARLEAITLGAFTERGLDDALDRALEIVLEAVGAPGGAIALRDEQGGGVEVRAARGDQRDGTTIPLRLGGEDIGSLSVGGELGHEQRELLDLLAERTVLAIVHVELRDREARLALALQRALLPIRLPQHPAMDIAWRHRAMVRDADVGGDFYDALLIDDGRVGLCIGDVMGKGLRAAATMGRLRSTIRAYALDGSSPAAVLNRADRFMADEEDMATAIYLALDTATGRAHMALAGHPPPILVAPGSDAREVSGGVSTPLGTGDRSRPESTLVLPPGGRLILYTDGLVEHRPAGIIDGIERLCGMAAREDLPLEELCDDLLAGMEGEGYSDDVALLAVERRR